MAAALKSPGLARAGFGAADRRRVRLRPRRRPARDLRPATIFQTEPDRLPAPDRAGDHRPARLPGRPRLLRLLVPLGRPAGRPIPDDHSQHGAKSLARLLQVQHRSQGDRDPVHRHHLLLLLRRRPDRDGDPRRARPAGHADRRPGRLQRALLDPRGADDLRLRDPGLRRDRELRPAADDRRAGHGVPAPERALLLDAADRRRSSSSPASSSPAAPSTPAGPATRRSPPARRSGSRSSTSACSSPAPHRWRPRSTSWSRSSPCVRRG